MRPPPDAAGRHPLRDPLRRPRQSRGARAPCSPTPPPRAPLGVLCLGDLVGYGADPVACVELVGERASAMVAGNHEHGALGLLDLDWFNPARARPRCGRASSSTTDHRGYLGGAAARSRDGGGRHPRAREPAAARRSGTISSPRRTASQVFGDFDTRLCFVGHSHLPGVWSLGSGGPDHERPARPAGGRRCGSTTAGATSSTSAASGQPRDRDPRAALRDLGPRGARAVTIRRVAYDHAGGGREDPRRRAAARPGRSTRAWGLSRLRRARRGPRSRARPRVVGRPGRARVPDDGLVGAGVDLARARAVLGALTRAAPRRPRWTAGSPAPCSLSCSCAGSTTPSCTTARSRGR